ncbi:YbgC/FadM family acyl-CoA thioesterase [Sphingomonas sp. IC-56]|uniref:YbgC/FadM family acyl-CoA thioesterase n=1 Tax=Sphingomonas sp. IC-56 TaxID=2898529 RepID=UPI001E5E7BCF|nr:YbgC/FadM family acyl-CoA thioesterase [Sphingomonas sp. IC-56]MCD2324490.1 YbgC/FadM family acyl-CoA thioesterase [Sphingomonas sp. IC-56]
MTAPAAIGRFEGLEHRFGLRVYFEDTDLTGIVYHANYLRYMERARSDMLAAAGIDQRAVFEAGEGAYAVRDIALRYRTPARLSDDLMVVSRLTELRGASVRIQQRVMRGETIVAQAEVEAAFVSPTGKPRRQPQDWVAKFEPLLWKGN